MAETTATKSREEMEKILRDSSIGYLGMCCGDEPYVVPMNYIYIDGKIIIHGARNGKKLDFIRENPRVCFTVSDHNSKVSPHSEGAECSDEHVSVICYGIARIIDSRAQKKALLDMFNRNYVSDAKEISLSTASKCSVIEIKPDKMTGRQKRKGKRRIEWEYNFSDMEIEG